LTGANSYTGHTTVSGEAELVLSGNGSIAPSSKVTVDGEFDIADTNSGATITTLAGDGDVTLGENTLVISNGSSQFSGVIGGRDDHDAGGRRRRPARRHHAGELERFEPVRRRHRRAWRPDRVRRQPGPFRREHLCRRDVHRCRRQPDAERRG